MSLKYRPEIDGLRAIAVVSVVLYHAELTLGSFNPFKGGFIGVDIFFVISGYLITLIILKDLQAGAFSFLNFYQRRARRIFPLLLTVMLLSLPLAWHVMLPDAFQEYAGSILSSLAFGSNFWFWLEDSYWAAPSAAKPFLHTWSLSVEEQYYIIFPTLLLFLWRYIRLSIANVIAIMGIVSLVLAHFLSNTYPEFSFFMLPTRAWELLAGAWLAAVEIKNGRRMSFTSGASMSTLGCCLVLVSLVVFDKQTVHPSLVTVLPVLGSMLLIRYAGNGDYISKMMSSKCFVGIGKISYGLYLWHFPIFAFAIVTEIYPTDFEKIGLVTMALMLSVASHFLIESPFRNRRIISTSWLWVSIVIATSFLLISMTCIYRSGGIPERMPFGREVWSSFKESDYQSICSVSNGEDGLFEKRWCVIGDKEKKPDYLLVGDSHALAMLSFFDRQGKANGQSGYFMFRSGCPSLLGVYTNRGQDNALKCKVINDEAFAMARDAQVSTVFLISRWDYYIDSLGSGDSQFINRVDADYTLENSRLVFREQLRATLNLYADTPVRTVIMLQVPQQSREAKKIFAEIFREVKAQKNVDVDSRLLSNSLSYESHIQRQAMQQEIIVPIAQQYENVFVIDPANSLCGKVCSVGNSTASYYYDDDHVSWIGAERLKPLFADYLRVVNGAE